MAAESFRVKIEGFRNAEFAEIDGLSGAIEVVEFQDGDDLVERKRPGRVSFGNITLRRGKLEAKEFYRWWFAASVGKVKRRSVGIQFLDARNRVIMSWKLEAWPVSWNISAQGAKGGGLVALETFVLAVETLEFNG